MKSTAIFLILIASLVPGNAQEIVIRSPRVVWNSYSFLPFLILFPTSSIRYQQVWGASGFFSQIPQGGWITQVAFNLDGLSGPFFGTTLADVQVNFSTTGRGPDALNSTFEENIGTDETVVYGRGPLTLPPPSQPFDQVVVFDSPFLYDPSQGNLLMDVWNYQGYTPDPLSRPGHSANDSMNDSASIVYSSAVDDTSGFVSTVGLVAQFTIIPIPEPAPWLLAGLAVVLGVLSRWQSKRKEGR